MLTCEFKDDVMLFALIKFTELLSFSEGLSQCTSQNMHFEVIIQISRKYRDSSIQQIVVTFNWALGAGCRKRWINTDWNWKVGNISTKLSKSNICYTLSSVNDELTSAWRHVYP